MLRLLLTSTLLLTSALAANHAKLDARQACPAACSGCCNAIAPAGCYQPLQGPDKGEWGCYDSPPGEIVDVVSSASNLVYSSSYYPASASVSAVASGSASGNPYASYSSAGYSGSSSAYSASSYSSAQNFGSSSAMASTSRGVMVPGPTTTIGLGTTPSVAVGGTSASASPTGGAAATGAGVEGKGGVRWGLMVLAGICGLVVRA